MCCVQSSSDLSRRFSRHDVSAVAVTGAGMAGTPGVAARVFKAWGQQDKCGYDQPGIGSAQYILRGRFHGWRKGREELHSEFGLGGEV